MTKSGLHTSGHSINRKGWAIPAAIARARNRKAVPLELAPHRNSWDWCPSSYSGDAEMSQLVGAQKPPAGPSQSVVRSVSGQGDKEPVRVSWPESTQKAGDST